MKVRKTPLLVAAFILLRAPFAHAAASQGWPTYAGTNAALKYSSLNQINSANVNRLGVVWRWNSVDDPILKQHPSIRTWKFESTPIFVGGVLYTSTSLSQVAAIDAASGRTIWVFDPHTYDSGPPPNFGFVHRGVGYWTDGRQSRIFIGTGNAYLIALDAKTGKPVCTFGRNGKIDLTKGLLRPVDRSLYGVSSPPLICRDTVIVGSSIIDYPKVKPMPRGDVRAFDARTGALRWTFHTIPLPGEPGSNTWPSTAWKDVGAANVWPPMSADDALGYVYLPVSSPSSDFYGAERRGNGLFGDSLVCLDAASGKLIWHFQLVHHDLWDRDPPAAPILVDIPLHRRVFKGVAQVTKQGFVYVFDRLCGAPLWPIEERPVPKSKVPGESSSPTQPIPSKPAPFDIQGLTSADLIDFTPELHRKADSILAHFDHGPLYLPPTEKNTVISPGVRGGASWSGAAFDPFTGVLYVPSITAPNLVQVVDYSTWMYRLFSPFPQRYRAFEADLMFSDRLPITKPPYGRVTAIDLVTGDHLWMQPMGNGPRNHPALKRLRLGRLGWPYRGFPLLTSSLLFIAQEGSIVQTTLRAGQNGTDATFADVDPAIQVLDKRSGELTQIPLPANASGSPLTYLCNGRQYIVTAVGGGNIPAELVALALR